MQFSDFLLDFSLQGSPASALLLKLFLREQSAYQESYLLTPQPFPIPSLTAKLAIPQLASRDFDCALPSAPLETYLLSCCSVVQGCLPVLGVWEYQVVSSICSSLRVNAAYCFQSHSWRGAVSPSDWWYVRAPHRKPGSCWWAAPKNRCQGVSCSCSQWVRA